MFFDESLAPAMYSRLRESVLPQLLALTDAEAMTSVTACPGWSVTNVMAHVSGLVAETLAGVPLPRGSGEATARQVADRADLSLMEICDEWVGNADAFAAFGADDPAYVAALTSDLVVHAIDIGESLGREMTIDPDSVGLVAGRYGEALLQRAIDADCPLTLVLDQVAVAPTSDGVPPLVLRATSFNFLRAVTGRRSASQVRQMDWTGDPEKLMATAWSQYGPFLAG